MLRATKAELGSAGRDLNFGAYADARSLFRYDMHTLPSEISETIGTSTLFAAWNAAVYVAQIEDQRLSEAISSGAYLDATKAVLQRAWRAVVLGRILRHLAQAGFRLMDAVTLTAAQRQRAVALIGDCSIEIVAARRIRRRGAARSCSTPGTTVFVNHPPSVTHHDIVAACARLRRAGFVPVPHVAARRLASFTQASDFLQRAVGEAGVDRILLIGGDDSPVGPFRASLDLLATGVVERHGIAPCRVRRLSRGPPGDRRAARWMRRCRPRWRWRASAGLTCRW